jgi:DNA polymerase-3 subunit alpha
VATNDVHYLSREDAAVHDVLLCIQTGKTVHDTDRLKFKTDEFYFKSAPEMAALFKDHPEALQNTLRIAERCRVDFKFDQLFLPAYEVPEGKEAAVYLEELCREGLRKRYPEITAQLEQRLSYELKIINQMGYASYFLIVWDLIRYARSAGVLVGPGRGSAAGSLVAYCLGITDIDPIRNALLFERFLNPERISMPDIDIDFSDDKRDRVLNYVAGEIRRREGGPDHHIRDHGRPGAVRDVGRALAFPYGEVDRVAKMIPNEIGMTINRALEQSKELKALYREEERYRQLLDTSMAVEGLPRHASIHAAGVVIAREPLVKHVPLLKTNDQTVVTQFPMGTLEQLGLLKMDFLGLKTLTIIEESLAHVRRRHGREIRSGARSRLTMPPPTGCYRRARPPVSFSLKAPGCAMSFASCPQQVRRYRRRGRPLPARADGADPGLYQQQARREPIHYPHPVLEPILKETYGVIVYQEQIMEIAATMAGFSLGQADLLRRAIGKKKKEILDQQQELFIRAA